MTLQLDEAGAYADDERLRTSLAKMTALAAACALQLQARPPLPLEAMAVTAVSEQSGT